MLAEAERFKQEGRRPARARGPPVTPLEAYVYACKQAAEEAPADRLSPSEKEQVLSRCREAIAWIDANGLAEKDEFEHRLRELQQACGPLMAKLHQQPGGGKPAHQYQQSAGPTVEEVD
ncbi:hypothetical protein HPB48_026750 [Haemaphysalis longicornis]|uniref:Uncharacterized protein n=1 Tax=Haemaphysalis longicornis TaxID=44386 RepID=A0A9J6HCM2_HAELO|nr:hypothetical protein HPB48_026750 [Haemaphysalis longicornis]